MKTRDFYFFMTELDEIIFCEALRNEFSNICLFDVKPSFESDIDKRLYVSVEKVDSTFFLLLILT